MSEAIKAEAQMAQMALAFLRRTELKGGEVDAFVNVHNWLLHKIDKGKSVFENGEVMPFDSEGRLVESENEKQEN